LWTTRTKKSGQTLANREYTISAVVDGQIYELYVFETSVPAGSPPGDANVEFKLTGASPAAEVYGSPLTKESRAALEAAAESGQPGRPEIKRVGPPDVLVEALERTTRTTPELAHPAVVRTGKRLESLTKLLEGKLLRHALGSEDIQLVEAIDALTNAVQDLHREITTTAPDAARLARLDAAIKAFAGRAARWTDHVTAADVRALVRQLEALRGER
jgi:hypothetical protein